MVLIEGDLVRLNTRGYSDFDGSLGVILKIDQPWYTIADSVCKIFFPKENDFRYYNARCLEKIL
jgi:hypothetical protein